MRESKLGIRDHHPETVGHFLFSLICHFQASQISPKFQRGDGLKFLEVGIVGSIGRI
jgi:hypothetical protein